MCADSVDVVRNPRACEAHSSINYGQRDSANIPVVNMVIRLVCSRSLDNFNDWSRMLDRIAAEVVPDICLSFHDIEVAHCDFTTPLSIHDAHAFSLILQLDRVRKSFGNGIKQTVVEIARPVGNHVSLHWGLAFISYQLKCRNQRLDGELVTTVCLCNYHVDDRCEFWAERIGNPIDPLGHVDMVFSEVKLSIQVYLASRKLRRA